MKNCMLLLQISIIGLFLVAGCDQNATASDSEKKIQSVSGIKEFDIIAQNWEFIPDTIIVSYGDMVKLHVESADVPHGFALPDFGINERLEPHQDVHITFVADKKGTFTFSCSVECGSGHSRMKGQLIVK